MATATAKEFRLFLIKSNGVLPSKGNHAKTRKEIDNEYRLAESRFRYRHKFKKGLLHQQVIDILDAIEPSFLKDQPLSSRTPNVFALARISKYEPDDSWLEKTLHVNTDGNPYETNVGRTSEDSLLGGYFVKDAYF